ncbi:MAG: CPBP family intramembrane metalloprotease [Coprococcus sp.]|nr:CPBP family intramembrane metalloprotease [Coprococcus sp.]
MYKSKDKSYFLIAVIYWIIYMVGLLIMGVLYKNNISHYNIIYYILFAISILIVVLKDKRVNNLGFTKENIKQNLLVSISLIAVTFIISVFISEYSFDKLLKVSFYYLFYISLVEEVIYRGFIQNYLFGLKANKYLIFIIGALLFSFTHLPFQMYVNNNVSLNYVIEALPQLLFCFTFHLIMCLITYKRKDITIPIALHYAIDYIQRIL